MKIGTMAHVLGVPVPTLRRWTQEFSEALSPAARGGDGRPREFLPRDQRVLRRVCDLLAERDVTYARVREVLEAEKLTLPPDSPPTQQDAAPATQEERQAAERFVAEVIAIHTQPWIERVQRLEAEVARLDRIVRDLSQPVTAAEPDSSATRRRWPFG